MLHSVFARAGADFAPVVIRLTGLVVILVYVFDFFRRRGAARIMDALKEAGAVSPDSAVGISELKDVRFARLFLKEYAPLRRVVAALPDQTEACDGEKTDKKTGKKRKKQKPLREDVRKLRFYIPERDDSRELPVVLRGGGEKSVYRLAVGVVLAVVATELLVYFFPEIKSMLTSPEKLFE